jgi:uncharacterized protein
MLYALFGEDVANSLDLRQKARPDHLKRIEALQAEGRLILAGPFPSIDSTDPGLAGYSGSLIVAEFASQTDAEVWFKADPYVTNGIFGRTEVRPFKQVFPK